jgi:phosphate transport system substrate-binding protein
VQPYAEVLAEDYFKIHPDASVNVQGGGSAAGIQAAAEGAAQIGMSSRALKPSETAVTGILIAKDGIAVIVHPDNPTSKIDVETLRRVFTGQLKSWKQLGWVDKPITIISREDGSGTRTAFDDAVMGGLDVYPLCIVQDSNGAVRVTVAQDRYSIGYVSLGLVDKSVKALALNGVEPNFETASSGKYPLVRPFLFLVKGAPEGLAKEYIDFVLSDVGQKILTEEGLIPVNAGKTH